MKTYTGRRIILDEEITDSQARFKESILNFLTNNSLVVLSVVLQQTEEDTVAVVRYAKNTLPVIIFKKDWERRNSAIPKQLLDLLGKVREQQTSEKGGYQILPHPDEPELLGLMVDGIWVKYSVVTGTTGSMYEYAAPYENIEQLKNYLQKNYKGKTIFKKEDLDKWSGYEAEEPEKEDMEVNVESGEDRIAASWNPMVKRELSKENKKDIQDLQANLPLIFNQIYPLVDGRNIKGKNTSIEDVYMNRKEQPRIDMMIWEGNQPHYIRRTQARSGIWNDGVSLKIDFYKDDKWRVLVDAEFSNEMPTNIIEGESNNLKVWKFRKSEYIEEGADQMYFQHLMRRMREVKNAFTESVEIDEKLREMMDDALEKRNISLKEYEELEKEFKLGNGYEKFKRDEANTDMFTTFSNQNPYFGSLVRVLGKIRKNDWNGAKQDIRITRLIRDAIDNGKINTKELEALTNYFNVRV